MSSAKERLNVISRHLVKNDPRATKDASTEGSNIPKER